MNEQSKHTSRTEEAAKARRRRYHAGREAVKARTGGRARIAPERMSVDALWTHLVAYSGSAVYNAEQGADPERLELALDIDALILELRDRGQQMTLLPLALPS